MRQSPPSLPDRLLEAVPKQNRSDTAGDVRLCMDGSGTAMRTGARRAPGSRSLGLNKGFPSLMTSGQSAYCVKYIRREPQALPVVIEPMRGAMAGHVCIDQGGCRRSGKGRFAWNSGPEGLHQNVVTPELIILVPRRRCVKAGCRRDGDIQRVVRYNGLCFLRLLGGLWKEGRLVPMFGRSLRWIVGRAKGVEQVGVRRVGGIEGHPDGLPVIADIGMGRRRRIAARKPDAGVHHPVEAPEYRIGAPEAAKGKHGMLTPGRPVPVHWGARSSTEKRGGGHPFS